LPIGVVGSAAIATSMSGRAWVATSRSSRWAFSWARLIGSLAKMTVAQIFSLRIWVRKRDCRSRKDRGMAQDLLFEVAPGEVGDVTAAVGHLLPSYMIPTRSVFLHRMPLTSNGKLDRRAVVALLEPEAAEGPDAQEGRPGNDVEAALAEIFAEVLGVESVGVQADFFGLGGDSVWAVSVIARIRDWLDIDHAVVADLFATRTVAGLAERLQWREAQRGTGQRLAVIARHYLDVAELTDEEVLADGRQM
jgi:mycobactin phenyloxazoline synthetase